MRISAKAKEETRIRILEEGQKLFTQNGYGETTTRDIASVCGLATGTLFNYFPNKEALGMAILAEALDRAEQEFLGRLRDNQSLEEELFAHIAMEMRQLKPCRGFVGEILEGAFSPFGTSQATRSGDEARLRHMECVGAILHRHDFGDESEAVTMHLYWTLYLGVLAFWSKDASPKQEDSLAVLDQSVRLFASTVCTNGQEPRK